MRRDERRPQRTPAPKSGRRIRLAVALLALAATLPGAGVAAEDGGPMSLRLAPRLEPAPRGGKAGPVAPRPARAPGPALQLTPEIDFPRGATQLQPPAAAAKAGAPPVAPDRGRLTQLVAAVTLNQEKKGDYFVFLDPDGNAWMRIADLRAIGVQQLPETGPVIEGERYLPLSALTGLSARFVERTLTVELEATADRLATTVVDFRFRRPENVLRPDDNSAFLNYLAAYSWSDSDLPGVLSLDLQFNARLRGVSLFSEHGCDKLSSTTRCVRGFTNAVVDRPLDLQRLTVGDFLASSGELGSTLNLGGLSFAKAYDIDPYFIRKPLASLTGFVPAAARAQILLDGLPIGDKRLPPGNFAFDNIDYYGGSRGLEVVLRDARGAEQRLYYPFYFTDALLRQGLSDYSYNLGFLRQAFGVRSWDYGKPALSFFHRHGFTDSLTLGVRGEATDDAGNIGPQAVLGLGRFGILAATAAASRDGRNSATGTAGTALYSYESARISGSLTLRGFSRDYVTAGEAAPAIPAVGVPGFVFLPVKPKFESFANLSYGLPPYGTAGVNLSRLERFNGPVRESAGVSFSGTVLRNLSVFGAVSHVREGSSGTEFFIGLSYTPTPDYTASYTQSRRKDGFSQLNAQFGKRVPAGEGFGFNVAVDGRGTGSPDFYTASPFAQYNGRYGEYRVSATVNEGGRVPDTYQVATAGSLAYVADELRLTRPITDSFAVVRLPGVAGVRVYQNNEEIGRTDASGTVFVPRLSSYVENQLRIDHRDVPMEFALKQTAQLVAPPRRSGSLVAFEATRYQAITGRLLMAVDGARRPAEYVEMDLRGEAQTVRLLTGRGGEFFLESLPPGSYRGELEHQGRRCAVEITIPSSEEVMLNVGDAVCEAR